MIQWFHSHSQSILISFSINTALVQQEKQLPDCITCNLFQKTPMSFIRVIHELYILDTKMYSGIWQQWYCSIGHLWEDYNNVFNLDHSIISSVLTILIVSSQLHRHTKTHCFFPFLSPCVCSIDFQNQKNVLQSYDSLFWNDRWAAWEGGLLLMTWPILKLSKPIRHWMKSLCTWLVHYDFKTMAQVGLQ